MRRRDFIASAAAVAFVAASVAYRNRPDSVLRNPCLAGLPRRLADHPVVRGAWDGIDPQQVWDGHVHLAGAGHGGTGIYLNPGLRSLSSPRRWLRTRTLFDAACVDPDSIRIDQDFVARLAQLANELPAGAKLVLLAFDYAYANDGRRLEATTDFAVPDEFAAALAASNPARFEWIASIHPYRADAVAAVERARRRGARAVKWLPAAMGMDPAATACNNFYDALATAKLPLLSHAGEEGSVDGVRREELGNPLRLARAVERGVTVIVAHCANMGYGLDWTGQRRSNLHLFFELVNTSRFPGQVYGDISALLQVNRPIDGLAHLLHHEDLHAHLINGSDYPLPGVPPLISVRRLVASGLLSAEIAPTIVELRHYNPLLFDFVLKRHLAYRGKRFPAKVFETRRVLAARA